VSYAHAHLETGPQALPHIGKRVPDALAPPKAAVIGTPEHLKQRPHPLPHTVRRVPMHRTP